MGLNKIKDKGVQTGTWKILITGPFGGLYQEQTKGTWWCWLRRNMKAEVEGGRGPPHINISFAFQTGLLSKVLIISLVLACTSQVALIIKNLPANARDTETQTGLIPGLGRSPRGGNGNPLQCSGLGNPMDWGAWWATAHEIAKKHDWATNIFTSLHFCQGPSSH